MTAPAKVEQRHRDEAEVLLMTAHVCGTLTATTIAESLANAEQRGREDTREQIARLFDGLEANCMQLMWDSPEYASSASAGAALWRSAARYARGQIEKVPKWCTCNDAHTCEGHRA